MQTRIISFILGCCLLNACGLSVAISQTPIPADLKDGIRVGSLKEAGIRESSIRDLIKAIDTGYYPNRHSLLIYKNDKLVLEKYFSGDDQVWGENVGEVKFDANTLHDVRSISKSVVSACIGIAISQGKIKSPDQHVFDFFKEYSEFDTGYKRDWKISHLLSMTSGLEWNEDIPYDNPENSEIQMIFSGDPIRFVLSRPMSGPPGKEWKYNGGTTQLLAAIIEKVSGKKVDVFAEEYIFKPLGITSWQWVKYPNTTVPAAASGLRLRPRDLLKFGILYLNNGKWKDQQLIPSAWVEQSFISRVARDGAPGNGYGYQFWLWDMQTNNRNLHLVACVGNGDQRIFFDRENHMLVVTTAGIYNQWDIKNDASAILSRIYSGLPSK